MGDERQSGHGENSQSNREIYCPVCLSGEVMLNSFAELNPCGHRMHQSCLLRWIESNNSCPVCRRESESYSHLNADGTASENVTQINRVTRTYPGSNAGVFYQFSEGVVLFYAFGMDQVYLRSGNDPIEFWRMDKLPSVLQFTVERDQIVQIYNIIIEQASNYMLKFNQLSFNLDSLLSSLLNRFHYCPTTGRIITTAIVSEGDLEIMQAENIS